MKSFYIIIIVLSSYFAGVAQVSDSSHRDVIVFVNGFWGKQKFSPARCNKACYWQYDSIQIKPQQQWNYNQSQVDLFFQETTTYFGTSRFVFVDGGHFMPVCSARKRYKKGFQYLENQLDTIFKNNKLNENSKVHFVTHSMGGAYAEGMIQYLITHQVRVGKVLHISPSEASDIKVFRNEFGPEKRIQLISQSDGTVALVNRWHRYKKDNLIAPMKDCDLFACFFETEITRPQAGDIGHALHMRKIAFDIIKDIENVSFCGDENCVVLENNSNKIPYRKVCKGGYCVFFDRKKGYFVPIKY
jgi:hypothetical protein